MKPNDFKKLLDEALKPIVITQKEHTNTLSGHTKTLNGHSRTLASVTKTLDSHSKTLVSVTKTLDSHTRELRSLSEKAKTQAETLSALKTSVLNIETTNNVYGDMYKINNDNAKKLEKRVITLEDNADIEPPPEQILLKVQ